MGGKWGRTTFVLPSSRREQAAKPSVSIGHGAGFIGGTSPFIPFLRCQRYIECNPVRAQMVRHPAQYRWSSFGANGEGKASALITAHAEYLALGGDSMSRRIAYLELFRAELEEADLNEIRGAANGSYALGAERFVKKIERMTGRRATAGKPGRPALERPAERVRQNAMF